MRMFLPRSTFTRTCSRQSKARLRKNLTFCRRNNAIYYQNLTTEQRKTPETPINKAFPGFSIEILRELGIREDELDLVHHDRKNTEDGYIDTYSMVYTNLIAVITHELQLEKERRSNLEIEVADLRSELESMRDNISGDTN